MLSAYTQLYEIEAGSLACGFFMWKAGVKGHRLGHKSDLAATDSGMAFISLLMHRNSPSTVISATQMMLMSHHDNVWGNCLLYTQQATRWITWTVTAKSVHCFALWTATHNPKALQKEGLRNIHV